MQCICNNLLYILILTRVLIFVTPLCVCLKMEPSSNTFHVQEFDSSKLADRRERRTGQRRERDRARHASETAAQREEKLRLR